MVRGLTTIFASMVLRFATVKRVRGLVTFSLSPRRSLTTSFNAPRCPQDSLIEQQHHHQYGSTPPTHRRQIQIQRGFSAGIDKYNRFFTAPSFRSCRLFATGSNQNSFASDEALISAKRLYSEAAELYERNIQSVPKNLDMILEDLERESSDPSFWDAEHKDRNAVVTAQISKYSRLKARVEEWKKHKGDAEAAFEILGISGFGEEDENEESVMEQLLVSPEERELLIEELTEAAKALWEDGDRYQLELLLSGPYDEKSCRLIITAGAGGTEANDWVADLKRMYERHAANMGYKVVVEDSQPGDVVGFKSVELIISDGPHAYGWFQGEKGAHRLVRLSPFNSNNKRQTTFAGVDVAPILPDQEIVEIEIPDKDLEITTMRSGGAGGQNVNKVNSAVRIKHLPSGLNVKCTQERSQSMNKDLAMQRLKAQLLAIAMEQRVNEIKEIRGDQVEAAWGQQIRNYVLHPYKMIKDQRTNWETTNAQGFLDGDMENCISTLLRHRAKEREAQQQAEETSAAT